MPEPVEQLILPRDETPPIEDYTIVRDNEDYVVQGAGLERLLRRLDLNNPEAIAYLQNLFEKLACTKAWQKWRFQKELPLGLEN